MTTPRTPKRLAACRHPNWIRVALGGAEAHARDWCVDCGALTYWFAQDKRRHWRLPARSGQPRRRAPTRGQQTKGKR